MKNEQQDREEEIFLRALELPPGEERGVYLDEACGEDAELRREIVELLEAHEQPARVLHTAADGAVDAPLSGEQPGDRFGNRYELIEEIGRGCLLNHLLNHC